MALPLPLALPLALPLPLSLPLPLPPGLSLPAPADDRPGGGDGDALQRGAGPARDLPHGLLRGLPRHVRHDRTHPAQLWKGMPGTYLRFI